MKYLSLAFGMSFAVFLFGAAVVANIGGSQMPEMRGAWIAQALR
jgi:hypothetical protein